MVRRARERPTKHKEPQLSSHPPYTPLTSPQHPHTHPSLRYIPLQEPMLPSYIHADAKDVSLALLAKDVAKRLACGGRGAAEVKEHHF